MKSAKETLKVIRGELQAIKRAIAAIEFQIAAVGVREPDGGGAARCRAAAGSTGEAAARGGSEDAIPAESAAVESLSGNRLFRHIGECDVHLGVHIGNCL